MRRMQQLRPGDWNGFNLPDSDSFSGDNCRSAGKWDWHFLLVGTRWQITSGRMAFMSIGPLEKKSRQMRPATSLSNWRIRKKKKWKKDDYQNKCAWFVFPIFKTSPFHHLSFGFLFLQKPIPLIEFRLVEIPFQPKKTTKGLRAWFDWWMKIRTR